ncbi:SDR family NAD(P)-dependent oxidoreductase [Chelatococcus reniformis]|uniref:3-oxoacyl-ACP reductase n=1 Tax=Chelatococcus reniformis TaxID=1494448 RepID=A0A916U456_9HYPH|nr:SDR family NAD(P)-dependent oxidoreductase [Chelatococcus reniformis]GGC59616.1 3-oxoacyl-ACP reductase [Chelatococcus reniformis]
MDLQLNDKTALVTGSSKGIGEAIARTLAREGASVVVHGRDRSQAERVADAITAQGGRAYAVLGDLTQDEGVERLVAEAEGRVGAIDILINNAGGSGPKNDWRTTEPTGWTSTYDRNVLAAVRVTTRLLPGMRRAHWGRVINISSAAATMPPSTGPDYSAAKAAMNAMTASMAKAVAAEGVTVNAISPGTIRSAKLEDGFRTVAAERGIAAKDAPWADIQRDVLPLFAQVPVGRVGELNELADAVAFLASPLAGYITGVNLRVDGGLSPLL